MAADFDEMDEKFQSEIISALVQRHRINLNSDVGSAWLQPMPEDRINPCVTITRDTIADGTGRQKVRKPVLDEYEARFRRAGFEVTRPEEKSLRICITPIRARENEFDSLEQLRRKNETDLAKDPDLDEDPYA